MDANHCSSDAASLPMTPQLVPSDGHMAIPTKSAHFSRSLYFHVENGGHKRAELSRQERTCQQRRDGQRSKSIPRRMTFGDDSPTPTVKFGGQSFPCQPATTRDGMMTKWDPCYRSRLKTSATSIFGPACRHVSVGVSTERKDQRQE